MISRLIIGLSLLLNIGCSEGITDTNKNISVKPFKNKDCLVTPIEKSQKMINFIFSNMNKNYSFTGGGGISEIKLTLTDTYAISVLQEGRIDQFIYELKFNEKICVVQLIKKTEKTIKFGR